jgi:hypothetical protein
VNVWTLFKVKLCIINENENKNKNDEDDDVRGEKELFALVGS